MQATHELKSPQIKAVKGRLRQHLGSIARKANNDAALRWFESRLLRQIETAPFWAVFYFAGTHLIANLHAVSISDERVSEKNCFRQASQATLIVENPRS